MSSDTIAIFRDELSAGERILWSGQPKQGFMLRPSDAFVKSDSSGTITFGPSHPMASWYSGFTGPGTGKYAAPAFEMIDNAKQVYELLRKAQREM